jgi:hypothetical protein
LAYHKETIDFFTSNVDLKKKMEDEWRLEVGELDRERHNLINRAQNELVYQATDDVRAIKHDAKYMEV